MEPKHVGDSSHEITSVISHPDLGDGPHLGEFSGMESGRGVKVLKEGCVAAPG